MKKFSDSSLKRVLSLLLAIVMMIGLVPINAFAEDPETGSINQKTSSRAVDAEGKPPVDWDKSTGEGRDDGSSYWSLPSGVNIINAHNGSNLSKLSIRYASVCFHRINDASVSIAL